MSELSGTREVVPIAVVGVAGIFPGAASVAAFYRDLLEGTDRLTDVPRTHWLREDYFDPRPGTPDKVYAARGGFVPEVELAPLELGLPPSLLRATDSSQLLALVVAKQLLREATRGRWESMDRSRMSVVLGVASATELVAHMAGRLQIPLAERAMRSAGIGERDVARVREVLEGCYVPWQESTFPGLLGNVVAGRIANRFDLGGTNAVIDAACASSLAAVDVSVNELALGRSDLVITGGVDTLNDILMFMCFAQTQALSPSGDCRPFADDADGTMLGEGVGMLALRRLADAERDGDAIYAVIRGIGSSSDGRANSIYAPAPAGQALALRRAYERAGYGPDTVELVEAHGTGTKAGDAAELAALREVFEAAGAPPQRCALGSVKSQIGHTKAAAGAAGLLKAVMALHHGVLPPTIKVKAPSAALRIDDSPFHLNTTARPWIRGGDHPRRASVSSFGFGGTNFHAALEEYRGPAPRPGRMRAMPSELVLLAANDPQALADACRALARSSAGDDPWRVARRSQLAFDATAPARLAVVASDPAELVAKLTTAADLLATRASFSSPRGIYAGVGAGAGLAPRAERAGGHAAATGGAADASDRGTGGAVAGGAVAFLFPGQGSQYVGMGGDLAIHFAAALAEWDRAACVDPRIAARAHPPAPLRGGGAEELARALTATEWAQPAIAATSLSIVRVLERFGLSPDMVGGHSLGEVTALGVAGALDAGDIVAVARRRGELVAAAGTRAGAMIAISADLATAERLVASCDGAVIANHNAPAQVVLSGELAAIEALERALAAAKIEARRLAVSTAFHSPLIAGACAPFRAFLDGVRIGAPRVPVYSNTSAAPYPEAPAAIRDQLAGAVAARVRFAEQLEAMYAAGARVFVEVGPSGVLTRLVGRCLADRPHIAVALDAPDKHGVTALWDALGRLAAAGVPLDFARYWRDETTEDDTPATASTGFRVRISGVNYGKPSPPATPTPSTVAGPDAPSPAAASPAASSPAAASPISASPIVASPIIASPIIASPIIASPIVASPIVASPIALMAAPPPMAASPPMAVGATQIAIAESLIHAQMEYQRLMAESHTAFLRVFEAAHLSSGALAAVAYAAPASPASPVVYVAPASSMPVVSAAVAPLPAPQPPPPPAPPPLGAPLDLEALLLGVVADKTGYPAEMIDPTMDLESDLGIDSIKRVEILSAIRERAPGLPEVEPAHMGSLRTLHAIVAFLRDGGDGDAKAAIPSGVVAAGSQPIAAASQGVVARLVPCVVAAPAIGLAMPGLVGERVAVTDDGGGVAQALVVRLRAHAIEADVVDAVPEDAAAVVFLGGLREIASVDDAIAVHRAALASARAVAVRFQARGGAFVTVEDLGGDFGLSGSAGDRAWLGGVGALVKTAAHEWPAATVRAIDIARAGRSAEAIAEVLVDELLGGGPELEVGLRRDGERVAIATREAPGPSAEQPSDGPAGRPIDPGAFFVVSGGARGVTAASLVALARTVPLRLLLLGRTAPADEPAATIGLDEVALKRAALVEAQRTGQSTAPRDIARRVEAVLAAREVRETLRLLRDAGSEVRYAAVDICDPAQVAVAVEGARRAWGPVRGLVHAAGVVSDARIADKTAAQLDRVMSPKVRGLRALLDATAADPLAWLCLFSSVAARAGNAGQADYAMANEILNKVAAAEAQRRGDRCRVVSIGWGPWDGGMVTPSLRDHFAARGVGLLSLADGAAAFVEEIQRDGAAEVVIARAPAPWSRDRRALAADVLVDRRRWPQLDSHRIQGKVVLPMAVVLEWFARLARPLCSARGAIQFRDVRVVRAVTLARYADGETERLQLVGRPTDDGASVAVELRGATGALHYAATLDLRPAVAEPPARAPDAHGPWDGPALYGPSSLFHGSHFQVLRSIDGVSPEGARGTLSSTGQAGWPGGGWRVDPAALDGALQLAFLFGLRGGGGPSLPMRIARLVVHRSGDAGPLRCDLRQRERTRERLLCDLSLASGAGEPVADLLGVEMFTVPSGTTAS